MSTFSARRQSTVSWREYYVLYGETYREIVRRCFLGDVTFGQHVHHSAVPDAQGSSGGFLNWVAYSQPSARTLAVYLPTLATVLTKETHRANSRYILFASDEETLSPEVSTEALSQVPFPVDYWLGAMPIVLEQASQFGPLLGAELLFGKPGSAARLSAETAAVNILEQLRGSYSENSRVPPRLRRPFSDSFFVLWAFENAVSLNELSALLGGGVWLAAALAQTRVAEAETAASAYLKRALEANKGEQTRYIVQPGDTLGRIVRATYEMSFDTMWPLIRTLNPDVKNPDLIYPNQTLLLPILEA